MRLGAWILLASLSGAEAAAGTAPVTLGATGALSAGFDSNPQAAREGADGSAVYSALLAGDATWNPNNLVSTALRGQIQGDLYARFEDLSSGRAAIALRGSFKPGAGFFSPLLTASATAALIETGSDIRDGVEFRGAAVIAQNLTTRVSLRGELEATRRRSEGRVFDLSGQSVTVGFGWLLQARLLAELSYEFQDGDAVTTGRPTALIQQAAEAVAADDAFGQRSSGLLAYRYDADTRIISAGLNYRLRPDLAMDARVQSVGVDADIGARYRRTIAFVGLVVRF